VRPHPSSQNAFLRIKKWSNEARATIHDWSLPDEIYSMFRYAPFATAGRKKAACRDGGHNPPRAADFRKLITEETEKWAKVIKFAGIKPE
jgi:hypothetical protein